ncbi:MAG: hypothetical protein COT24_03525 [Candidatus Kerfeldbacteria bacterium CG08_land_8_20_14_0_20_40_16]|uniref:Tyrosine recombinase XerC n=1 Tax=Candidatus Kerfeldbacteria bacterium CG08_land_8_20_14_0_20_40_16 TaxID=2014244 RepID=A0A2H0YVA0_9BACT|nr:MAG: hypothetical protein COT24_03525 [Candidatus Kerfeldbacteria bacterium CG08_land_8_20_14_0_20_40_16]
MAKDIKQLKQDFLDYLEIEKNRSQATIRNYDFYLQRFFNWAKIDRPEQITPQLIKDFRLYLNRLVNQKKQPLKKSTQNYHVIALRSFLKYLAKQDIKTTAPEKIELAKMPDRQVDFLEGQDLERMLEAPLKTEENPIIQKRDKAILELFFSTGLRVSELANLKTDQINLKKDEFSVRGKGDKLRIVFLSPQAKYWLKQYLDARQDVSLSMFVRHDRAVKRNKEGVEAITPRSIQRLIKKYAKAAGITKNVTPHTLRHSFATDLLINGADIRSVQVMLGHASITTTQIYTHLTNQQLRDVHKAFHAKGRQKDKE